MKRVSLLETNNNIFIIIILLLLLCCFDYALAQDEVTSTSVQKKSWNVYHRVLTPGQKSSDWTSRGKIELTVDGENDETTEEPVSLTIENTELTDEFAKDIVNAHWYQIKLQEEDDDGSKEILTSVNACDVRRANFRDEFNIQLHPNTAKVISISYIPLISPLAPISCEEYQGNLLEKLEFISRVNYETSVPGMIVGKPPPKNLDPTKPQPKIQPPPGLKWIPGRKKRAGGATNPNAPFEDEQHQQQPQQEAGLFGFFKRYWYIIVPVMVINLLSAPEPEKEGQGGGGESGTSSSPQRQGVAAASPSSSGSSPRRRGKRD